MLSAPGQFFPLPGVLQGQGVEAGGAEREAGVPGGLWPLRGGLSWEGAWCVCRGPALCHWLSGPGRWLVLSAWSVESCLGIPMKGRVLPPQAAPSLMQALGAVGGAGRCAEAALLPGTAGRERQVDSQLA